MTSLFAEPDIFLPVHPIKCFTKRPTFKQWQLSLFGAYSFVNIWTNWENMTICWDASNIATKEFDITKCLSDHKTSAVNVKFCCQSLEIKEQGLLSTFYCLALTNNHSGGNPLWKRMSSFPVTVASLDQNSEQLEDRLFWLGGLTRVKKKNYTRKLRFEWNLSTTPLRAEMHSGKCREILNEAKQTRHVEGRE